MNQGKFLMMILVGIGAALLVGITIAALYDWETIGGTLLMVLFVGPSMIAVSRRESKIDDDPYIVLKSGFLFFFILALMSLFFVPAALGHNTVDLVVIDIGRVALMVIWVEGVIAFCCIRLFVWLYEN